MTPYAYCHRCGTPIDAGARYCKKCGTQRVDDPAVQSGASPPPPGAADQPLAGIDPYSATPPPSWPQATTQPLPAGTPQGYVAQPPTQSQPLHHRAWVAAAAVGGVLFIIAVVLVLALSGSHGGVGVHAAAVVTVTTKSPSTPPSSTSLTASSLSPSSPSANSKSDSPSKSIGLRLVSYRGARMTASIPAGWTIEESEVQKPSEVESKWSNPGDAADYLLIDERAATHLAPEQDAAPVHASTEQTSGYREIYYGTGDLTGVDSWMWVFELPAAERIDYFFERCTDTFGVLGSTSAAGLGQLRSTFRTVAQSVQSTCR
jgi:zinc-ribbon domain